MATGYPSLTAEGFIFAVDRKCDRILMSMFASDAGQSNMFAGSVTSIQNIIYLNSDDVNAAGTAVAAGIERVLSRYFDGANVQGVVTDIVDKPGRVDISIQGSVVQNNRRYDFGRMLESANGMIQSIMNNQGEVLWTNVLTYS